MTSPSTTVLAPGVTNPSFPPGGLLPPTTQSLRQKIASAQSQSNYLASGRILGVTVGTAALGDKSQRNVVENVVSANVDFGIGQQDKLTLVLLDPGLDLLNADFGARGTSVTYGVHRFVVSVREIGETQGVETMTLTCLDSVQASLKRDFAPVIANGQSSTDYAAAVAARYHLGFIGEPSPGRKHIVKSNAATSRTSEWDMLKKLGSQLGFTVFLSQGTLYFAHPSYVASSASGDLVAIEWNGPNTPEYLLALPEIRDSLDLSPQSDLTSSDTSATDGAGGAVSDATAAAIIADAQNYVGILPYVYGGTSLVTGADCSGTVQALYARHSINLPRDSQDQSATGTGVPEDQAQPGDLVYFGARGSAHHIAIYIGGGMMISNDHTGSVLQQEGVWPESHGYTRVIPTLAAPSATPKGQPTSIAANYTRSSATGTATADSPLTGEERTALRDAGLSAEVGTNASATPLTAADVAGAATGSVTVTLSLTVDKAETCVPGQGVTLSGMGPYSGTYLIGHQSYDLDGVSPATVQLIRPADLHPDGFSDQIAATTIPTVVNTVQSLGITP